MSVCLNCDTHEQEDVEVIGHLIKIRLKTKPLINHYMLSMKWVLIPKPGSYFMWMQMLYEFFTSQICNE